MYENPYRAAPMSSLSRVMLVDTAVLGHFLAAFAFAYLFSTKQDVPLARTERIQHIKKRKHITKTSFFLPSIDTRVLNHEDCIVCCYRTCSALLLFLLFCRARRRK